MKKLFLAIVILIAGAGATFAQTNNTTKPTQEKTKHFKKDNTTNKTTASPANATTKSVATNKTGKHHKKMKKEKASSGK